MRKLKYSGLLKALAVIMSAFMLLLSVASVWALLYAINIGLYVKPVKAVIDDEMSGAVRSQLWEVCRAYREKSDEIPEVAEYICYQMTYSGEGESFRVSNYDGDFEEVSSIHGAYRTPVSFANERTGKLEYYFDAYVLTDTEVYDGTIFYAKLLLALYSLRYWLIAVAVIAVTLTILLYIYAVTCAGERRDSDVAVRSWFDYIPFDILLVISLILAAVEVSLWEEFWWSYSSLFLIALIAAYIFVDSMIISVLSMSFVVRIKTKTLIKNNLISYVAVFVWRAVKTVFKVLARVFAAVCGVLARIFAAVCDMVRAIPTFWRGVVFWLICAPLFAFVSVVLSIEAGYDEFFFLFIVIMWLVVIGLGIWRSWNLARVKNGAKKIAEGDLEHKLSTEFMSHDYKVCAESLNSISLGMSNAVEEKMKGERFKTELISNVSHDIKTPITSIINYVDLLKKTDIKDEKAREYLEVLERQSRRLSKLAGDLVEASKASSGVIEVTPEHIELGIFLSQAAGEYEERLGAAGLSLVSSFPEDEVNIYADGKLMWRIIDNLLSNVCKYSLPGTRVYLSLSVSGTDAVITLNNISREAINYNGDELTERFVRGDMSRHTEGSGLGLSIAKSLTELQGGKMIIYTDSDLFKVTVRMKLAEWSRIEVSEVDNVE